MKKKFAIMFLVMMTIFIMAPVAMAAETTYSDINGHWAATAIQKWSDNGVLQGSNGLFRPDDPVTRGELAVILDRMMDYQVAADNTFTDLGNKYYTDAILKANAAGVMKGYANKVTPAANITRQDAVVMIARAFELSGASGYSIKATDAANIASYAKGAVAALESAGYVSGRGEGKFLPKATITRAEVVKILDNMITGFYTKEGTYSDTVNGITLVNVPNVTFKNAALNGNLIVAPGVASGDCSLDGTTVKGNAVVLGGGSNSVKFINNTKVSGSVIVAKVGDKVRIYTENGVELPTINVADGTSDVVLQGNFTNVNVNSEVKVVVPSGSVVGNLSLATKGAGLDNSGTVTQLTVAAEATNSTINNTGVITTANLQAPAAVTGSGTIKAAVLTDAATGTTFASMPASVQAPKGTAVTVGGKSYVSDGSSMKEGTSTGTTSGGGSGGGTTATTVSSVVLSYNDGSDKTMNATFENGAYTFDLTGLNNSAKITALEIDTNKSAQYTVGNKSINTNTKILMKDFLSLAGFANFDVTMDKVRALFQNYDFEGSVNGTSLKISFIFKAASDTDAYYTYEMVGTTVTATLHNDAGVDKVLPAGCDPVSFLIKYLPDTSTSYTLKIKGSSISGTATLGTYQKSDLTGIDTNYLISKIKNNNIPLNITKLSNLKGITLMVCDGNTVLYSLVLA